MPTYLSEAAAAALNNNSDNNDQTHINGTTDPPVQFAPPARTFKPTSNGFSSGPKQPGSGFKMSLRICGPKLSLCCTLVSAWGIVQLLVMGLAFGMRSVALVEDIVLEEKHAVRVISCSFVSEAIFVLFCLGYSGFVCRFQGGSELDQPSTK